MDSFSVLESQCGIDTSGLKTRPLERRPKRLSELSPFFTTMSKKGGAHCCYGRSPSGVRIGFGIEILFLQSQLQFFCAELSVIRFGLSNLYIKAKDPFFVKRTHWAMLCGLKYINCSIICIFCIYCFRNCDVRCDVVRCICFTHLN